MLTHQWKKLSAYQCKHSNVFNTRGIKLSLRCQLWCDTNFAWVTIIMTTPWEQMTRETRSARFDLYTSKTERYTLYPWEHQQDLLRIQSSDFLGQIFATLWKNKFVEKNCVSEYNVPIQQIQRTFNFPVSLTVTMVYYSNFVHSSILLCPQLPVYMYLCTLADSCLRWSIFSPWTSLSITTCVLLTGFPNCFPSSTTSSSLILTGFLLFFNNNWWNNQPLQSPSLLRLGRIRWPSHLQVTWTLARRITITNCKLVNIFLLLLSTYATPNCNSTSLNSPNFQHVHLFSQS